MRPVNQIDKTPPKKINGDPVSIPKLIDLSRIYSYVFQKDQGHFFRMMTIHQGWIQV